MSKVSTGSNDDGEPTSSAEVSFVPSPPSKKLPLIPGSADAILSRALQDQANVERLAGEQFDEEMEQHNKLKKRRVLLLAQQARRVAIEDGEAEAALELKDMLNELATRIRERRIALSAEGYQSYTFGNGDVYEGEWKNSRIHGRGVMRYTNKKQLYEGEWFLGARNGLGTFVCAESGTQYVGRWSDGKRHGKGELLEKEGVYRGDFHSGRVHGAGEYVYTDGHLYKGEWVDDLYEGHGAYFLPNGSKYEGLWTAGVPDGRGTYIFSSAHSYHGEWSNGQRHGKGKYSCEAFTYQGEWKNDTITGHGKIDYEDGSTYDGMFRNGMFHGDGILQSNSEIVYAGEWRAGYRHGHGMHALSQASYEGEWQEGHKHGFGSVRHVCGGESKGQWRNDVPHGKGEFIPAGMEQDSAFADPDETRNELRHYATEFSRGVCVSREPIEQYAKVSVAMNPFLL